MSSLNKLEEYLNTYSDLDTDNSQHSFVKYDNILNNINSEKRTDYVKSQYDISLNAVHLRNINETNKIDDFLIRMKSYQLARMKKLENIKRLVDMELEIDEIETSTVLHDYEIFSDLEDDTTPSLKSESLNTSNLNPALEKIMRPSYNDNLTANNFKSYKDLRNFARKNEFESLKKEMGGELSTRELSFKINSTLKSLDLSNNYSQINTSSYSAFPANNESFISRPDHHDGKTIHSIHNSTPSTTYSSKYLYHSNLPFNSTSDKKNINQSKVNLNINPKANLVSRNGYPLPNHNLLSNQFDNLLGIDSNSTLDP
jgi:hypothetical protein